MKLKCPCCNSYLSLSVMIAGAAKKITIERIAEIVSDGTGVAIDRMKSKSRHRDYVKARMQVMWLAKNYSHATLKNIGLFLGGRDHTTVIHGVKTIDDLMYTYESIASEMAMLSKLCEEVIRVDLIEPNEYLKAS